MSKKGSQKYIYEKTLIMHLKKLNMQKSVSSVSEICTMCMKKKGDIKIYI